MIGWILLLALIAWLFKPRSQSESAKKRRTKRLLKEGLTLDQIADKVKLSRDEVLDIKNEMWDNGWET